MVSVGGRVAFSTLFALTALVTSVLAQTWSTCNPTQGTCPANPALAQSINVDFTKGASSQFTSSGSLSYSSNGAQFTIARSGDSPTIASKWYIMFGHVEFVLKAAPGTGIVSSAILQSDDLDEIDFEWLGGDDNQVQSNYFGKGQTVTGYNRGAFHGATANHDQFHTYTIDWTKDQVVWQVDGSTVRVLTPATAEANQYPQTPMMVKVGVWAGGDPANSAGTVAWAGGQTDYTKGPYSMYVKSITVRDYSTGNSYLYSDTTGSWQSIKSNGGVIYSGSGGKDTPAVSVAPTLSTASGAPIPLTTDAAASSVYATRTGYPWIVATASIVTTTSRAPYTTIAGLPSGWTISNSGKVVPPSSGSIPSLSSSSSSVSALASSSASEVEVITSYDQQGSTALVTITTAVAGQSKSYGTVTPSIPLTGTIAASSPTLSSKSTSKMASSPSSGMSTFLVTGASPINPVSPTGTGIPQAVPANNAPSNGRIQSVTVVVVSLFLFTCF